MSKSASALTSCPLRKGSTSGDMPCLSSGLTALDSRHYHRFVLASRLFNSAATCWDSHSDHQPISTIALYGSEVDECCRFLIAGLCITPSHHFQRRPPSSPPTTPSTITVVARRTLHDHLRHHAIACRSPGRDRGRNKSKVFPGLHLFCCFFSQRELYRVCVSVMRSCN